MAIQTPADLKKESLTTSILNPKGLVDPAPYGYSHAVLCRGAADLAFIAGQGGENHLGHLPSTFEAQISQAYDNLLNVLGSMEALPNQVLKITTYVVDYNMSKLGIMIEQVKRVFGDALPAQTLVPVPRLALDGMLFEVDAVVALNTNLD